VNQSPKERFLAETERTREWNGIAESTAFQHALDMATLEFVERQSFKVGQVYDAQAVAHRIEGARQFSRVLINMGIKEVVSKRSEPSKLEYEHFDIQAGMKPLETPL
jgi:hypothetical protein